VTGREALSLPGGGGAFSPDGSRIAITGQDGRLRIYDSATGRGVVALEGSNPGSGPVRFSPDGSQIASGVGKFPGEVKLGTWDAVTGRVRLTLSRGDVHTDPELTVLEDLAFSPDGHYLACPCPRRSVTIRDTASGREVLTLEGLEGQIEVIKYSPDGRTIASGGADRTVRIWDAATGRQTACLRGHSNRVIGLAFSPDGSRLATAGYNESIRLWDTATGQEVLSLDRRRHFGGDLRGVTFSPDGRYIAAPGGGRGIYLFDATPASPGWREEHLAAADARRDAEHRFEAARCEIRQQWFAAIWHLNQLLALNPDDADLRARRDAARARLDDEERPRQSRTPAPELPADVFAK
jgi:WD40 repeat protein